MDCKLIGLLSLYVLALIPLEVDGRPTVPVSPQTDCVSAFKQTKGLINILIREAEQLQKEYKNVYNYKGSPPLADVPDSSISGSSTSEKLQDVYVKAILFQSHIAKLQEYQRELWGDQQSLQKLLNEVPIRLTHFLAKIKETLFNMDPEFSLPPTPPPPELSHSYDFAKKIYGGDLIKALTDWLNEVLPVLSAKELCVRSLKA